MSDRSFHNFHSQKRLFIAENCNTFFGTSSAAASPYPVILEFIELVPSKKLKMYFYSLHYLIAALKSKLGMNLFESVPENSFLSKTSNCQIAKLTMFSVSRHYLTLGHPEKQYSVMTGEVTRPCKSPTHYNRGHWEIVNMNEYQSWYISP